MAAAGFDYDSFAGGLRGKADKKIARALVVKVGYIKKSQAEKARRREARLQASDEAAHDTQPSPSSSSRAGAGKRKRAEARARLHEAQKPEVFDGD